MSDVECAADSAGPVRDTAATTTAAADAGELARSADALGNQLGRLQRVRERTVQQLGSRGVEGLDLAAYRCVYALLERGPMRSGALAEVVLSDPSTVSRHVAQLVALGHLERRPDPEDGRATVIAVTPAGREAAAGMRARRNERLAAVVGSWEPGERRDLVRLLTRLLDDYELHRDELVAGEKG